MPRKETEKGLFYQSHLTPINCYCGPARLLSYIQGHFNPSLQLKNDYAFKRVLGVEENKVILQDFIECVLDLNTDEITGLDLLDKELKKDKIGSDEVLVDSIEMHFLNLAKVSDLLIIRAMTRKERLIG